MTHTDDNQKYTLVEEAAGVALSRISTEDGDARAVGDFVRAFYQHVPPPDVGSRTPSDLADAALSFWRFAVEREPGRPKIPRAFVAGCADVGWRAKRRSGCQ